jgi:hypothetical protein
MQGHGRGRVAARTHLERDAGDGVAPGVGDPGGRRRGRAQHARKRLPLVQADGVPHEQYLLPLPPAQQVLPVEPGALAATTAGAPLLAPAQAALHSARPGRLAPGAPRFDSIDRWRRARVPRELAGRRAPPVLEVQLVGPAVLLAVELRLHEGAPRRVVHRQRVVVHPAALEQVARRHASAGSATTLGAPPSPVPRAVVLPRGLVPEAERASARARGGGGAQ